MPAVRGRRRAASSASLRRRCSGGLGGGNASLVREHQRTGALVRTRPTDGHQRRADRSHLRPQLPGSLDRGEDRTQLPRRLRREGCNEKRRLDRTQPSCRYCSGSHFRNGFVVHSYANAQMRAAPIIPTKPPTSRINAQTGMTLPSLTRWREPASAAGQKSNPVMRGAVLLPAVEHYPQHRRNHEHHLQSEDTLARDRVEPVERE